MKSIKKERKSLKQKVIDKMIYKMQPYVENHVKEFEKTVVEKVLHRIVVLTTDVNVFYDIDDIFADIRNGGYNLDDNNRDYLNSLKVVSKSFKEDLKNDKEKLV